jgi:hypothetical protein
MKRTLLVALMLMSIVACESEGEPVLVRGQTSSLSEAESERVVEAADDPHDLIGITLQPGDMMTAVRHTSPAVLVTLPRIAEELRALLLTAARVVTWPEREPVECEHTFIEADPELGEQFSILRFASDGLMDRWYAVEIDVGVLGSVQVTDEAYRVSDGAYVSRFRPGTEPTIRRVRVTEMADATSVRVELSERVRAGRAVTRISTRRDGSPYLGCDLADPDSIRSDFGSDVVDLRCPIGLSASAFELDLAELRTRSGSSLSTGFGAMPARIEMVPERARRSGIELVYVPGVDGAI